MSIRRIAIIGAGRMGRARAEASARLGATLVAVCDVSLQAAEALAGPSGAACVQNVEALDWSRLDVAFVCTPPSERGPAELLAIEHGVPFMVEKPIALSARQLKPVMSALATRPVVNAVGYMNRYRASIQAIKESLVGQPVLGCAAHWISSRYEVPWWFRPEESGGPINEQATHFVDLARYLVGDITHVQALAHVAGANPGLIESASIGLQFEGGQLGSLLYSSQADAHMINFEVFTKDRGLRLEGWDLQWLDGHILDPEAASADDRDTIFEKETATFFKAVDTDRRDLVLSDLRDAWASQRVVDAIREALRVGERVEVGV